MMRLIRGGVFAICCVVLASGCNTAASSPSAGAESDLFSGKLILTGSSTVAPLAAEIAKRFEQAHPAVRIDVQTGGSSRGIADTQSEVADIGMASRALKEGEDGLRAHRIAIDGICLLVHRDNPIQSLTDEQVVDLYTGKIANWKKLGGADAQIVVVHKAEGRATLEVFLEYFQLDNVDVQADVIIGDNQQAIKTVAGNPLAIGYVSIGAAAAEAQAGAPIKLLQAGEIAPTTENVAEGKFPITRPLNLITKGEPAPLAKAFIEFAQSEAVHELVKAQHFVPIRR